MDLPRCKAWRAEWDKADIEIVMGPESAAGLRPVPLPAVPLKKRMESGVIVRRHELTCMCRLSLVCWIVPSA